MNQQQSPEQKSPVTQQDVAKRAGVSRAVVSYVVNNGPRVVSPETRERVLKAIEELGYRPNKFAQGLKLQASQQAEGQIGLILGGASDILQRPYFGALLDGIYREAHRRNQVVRLVTFFDELQDPVFFNKNIHPEVLSGLLLVASDMIRQDPVRRRILERVRDRIENIVSLEHALDDLPAVRFDRVEAARMAVTHLISLGHTRIGYVGAEDDRLQGYQQAVLTRGLQTLPLFIQPGLSHTPEHGYRSVSQMLDSLADDPPTALFATSDEVAIGIIAAMHDRGIRVPQDMALASIDDIAVAEMIRPALTTVRVPKESFGVYALQMLAMREAHPDTAPASVLLPVELIVRESCGSHLR